MAQRFWNRSWNTQQPDLQPLHSQPHGRTAQGYLRYQPPNSTYSKQSRKCNETIGSLQQQHPTQYSYDLPDFQFEANKNLWYHTFPPYYDAMWLSQPFLPYLPSVEFNKGIRDGFQPCHFQPYQSLVIHNNHPQAQYISNMKEQQQKVIGSGYQQNTTHSTTEADDILWLHDPNIKPPHPFLTVEMMKNILQILNPEYSFSELPHGLEDPKLQETFGQLLQDLDGDLESLLKDEHFFVKELFDITFSSLGMSKQDDCHLIFKHVLKSFKYMFKKFKHDTNKDMTNSSTVLKTIESSKFFNAQIARTVVLIVILINLPKIKKYFTKLISQQEKVLGMGTIKQLQRDILKIEKQLRNLERKADAGRTDLLEFINCKKNAIIEKQQTINLIKSKCTSSDTFRIDHEFHYSFVGLSLQSTTDKHILTAVGLVGVVILKICNGKIRIVTAYPSSIDESHKFKPASSFKVIPKNDTDSTLLLFPPNNYTSSWNDIMQLVAAKNNSISESWYHLYHGAIVRNKCQRPFTELQYNYYTLATDILNQVTSLSRLAKYDILENEARLIVKTYNRKSKRFYSLKQKHMHHIIKNLM